MRRVKCYCNVCKKSVMPSTGKSYSIGAAGGLKETERKEGDVHLCLTCQRSLAKVLPNADLVESNAKFEACRGALAWVAQAVDLSPDPPSDEDKWHEWLIEKVTTSIHNRLRRGNWAIEQVTAVLMALDDADAPAAETICDRIIRLGKKASDAIARYDHYTTTIGKILDPVRKRRDDGEPAQSDPGEIRDIIHQLQNLRATVLRLQGVNV